MWLDRSTAIPPARNTKVSSGCNIILHEFNPFPFPTLDKQKHPFRSRNTKKRCPLPSPNPNPNPNPGRVLSLHVGDLHKQRGSTKRFRPRSQRPRHPLRITFLTLCRLSGTQRPLSSLHLKVFSASDFPSPFFFASLIRFLDSLDLGAKRCTYAWVKAETKGGGLGPKYDNSRTNGTKDDNT